MFREGNPAQFKVLIVDDDPTVAKTIESMLRKVGEYEIVVASNGFDAGIQMLQFQPELVILELLMPQIDGFYVCKKIKSDPKLSNTRVIAITGSPTDEMMSEAFQAGADEFLPKPFKTEELVQALQGIRVQDQSASSLAG